MKPPLIYEFRYSSTVCGKRRSTWWKFWETPKWVVLETWYDKNLATVRNDFTTDFQLDLARYFSVHTPRIGDRIIIGMMFQIVNVVYNFNHDRYEIWWVHVTPENWDTIKFVP